VTSTRRHQNADALTRHCVRAIVRLASAHPRRTPSTTAMTTVARSLFPDAWTLHHQAQYQNLLGLTSIYFRRLLPPRVWTFYPIESIRGDPIPGWRHHGDGTLMCDLPIVDWTGSATRLHVHWAQHAPTVAGPDDTPVALSRVLPLPRPENSLVIHHDGPAEPLASSSYL
jgi:hypothetical protein